jgi:protein-S-isoprenylcysteine O-methyltransferase Ste14
MLMLLRQVLAFAALPFVVTVVVPIALLQRNTFVFSPPNSIEDVALALFGGFALSAGAVLFATCVFLFWTRGRGTLAPWDPPRRFVAEGPYRFVRNPMITGVVLVLVGESCLLRSMAVAGWTLMVIVVNMIYIPLVEEPMLEDRFGASYKDYLKAVPRFVPRLRPWTASPIP